VFKGAFYCAYACTGACVACLPEDAVWLCGFFSSPSAVFAGLLLSGPAFSLSVPSTMSADAEHINAHMPEGQCALDAHAARDPTGRLFVLAIRSRRWRVRQACMHVQRREPEGE
jgi:hypothetical protein